MTYSRYGFQDAPLLYSTTAMPPGTTSGTRATMTPLYDAPDTDFEVGDGRRVSTPRCGGEHRGADQPSDFHPHREVVLAGDQ